MNNNENKKEEQFLNVSEKADRLLKLLAQKTGGPGKLLRFARFGQIDDAHREMMTVTKSRDQDEVRFLMHFLWEKDWIRNNLTFRKDMPGNSPVDLEHNRNPFDMGIVHVTEGGLNHLRELEKSAPDSSETSMAMCFDQPLPKATRDQVEKAKKKLAEGDYAGAITNCYTLVEELLKELLKKTDTPYSQNEGDIKKLYRQLSGPLNLNPKGKNLESYLKSILQGLQQQIDGLYHLANKTSDRHAQLYKPARRHAKLAVNATLAFCEFLLESHEYQKKQVQF